MTDRPILAVDVDGVLNALSKGRPPAGWADADVQGYRIRHNPRHGRMLADLAGRCGAQLVWCTTWEKNAAAHIAPLVGLPPMPWVPLEPGLPDWRGQAKSIGLIKGDALMFWAGDRPTCWLDDEWDAPHSLYDWQTPHLVIRVDGRAGLQQQHLRKAEQWLSAVVASPAGE